MDNEKLIFAIFARDVAAFSLWLKDNGYHFTQREKTGCVLICVDIGHDPGKAGRAFDVGYQLHKIESESVYDLRFKGGRGFSKRDAFTAPDKTRSKLYHSPKNKKQNARHSIHLQPGR